MSCGTTPGREDLPARHALVRVDDVQAGRLGDDGEVGPDAAAHQLAHAEHGVLLVHGTRHDDVAAPSRPFTRQPGEARQHRRHAPLDVARAPAIEPAVVDPGAEWLDGHVVDRHGILVRLEQQRAARIGARGTLLLEMHQDTVPIDHMTIEPFVPRIDDGLARWPGAGATSRGAWRRCWRASPGWRVNGRLGAATSSWRVPWTRRTPCSAWREPVRRASEGRLRRRGRADPPQYRPRDKGWCAGNVHEPGGRATVRRRSKAVNAIYRMGKLPGPPSSALPTAAGAVTSIRCWGRRR